MSSFNGQDLFRSGPHEFRIGGLALRHVLHEPPDGDGVQLSIQGRSARTITQTGELVADSPAKLRELAAAIEACLDGRPAPLVDHTGQRHAGVVMLEFDPGAASRVGVRHRMPYRIEYLQVQP